MSDDDIGLPTSHALIAIWSIYLLCVLSGHGALLAAIISVSWRKFSRIEVLILNLSISDVVFVIIR